MNLNSRLFDSIRVRRGAQRAPAADVQRCAHPGCNQPGEFRAPMGRDREGQYFCFCLDHVREYNATYNYFNGMSDEAVAAYQREALVGHRPTWNMGVNRAGKGHREDAEEAGADPLGMFRGRATPRGAPPRKPRHSAATVQALATLGLDETAGHVAVRTRYKELVKRLHPDSNGGDRSSEDRLREIIRAYKFLRTVKLDGEPARSGGVER